MSIVQDRIRDNMILAYERLGALSGKSTFVQTDRVQRFESDIPFGLFNGVFTYTYSGEADPAEEIKSLADLYRERGRKLAWVTYSHEPDDVIDKALAANDFKQVDSISGMALSLENWSSEEAGIPGLEVRAIREPREIAQYRKVILAGFGIPEQMADLFSQVFVDGPNADTAVIQHYLAYLDGNPVTTITTFTQGDVTGIYNIATLEAYRGRGLARATLDHVVRDVQAKGAEWAVIHATAMGASVYPKVGFKEEMTFNIYAG
ncbi:GNAT family N-acetyltransferase [Paenibacillus glycinis]|uniref:GNAT family N-acetyltransferase n=1 Tax=Paenibacillus glycinis TaxID=2697035 RepID=A0ABW9XRI6_9BACL|nr:GNAT family N-acetyltransferase [Paenibacillus glycinis]NBD25260.1 GNAT family N-acetyltransferase [Paenibacillus glycinis]